MVNPLYDGKLFYEVIFDKERRQVFFNGPLNDIRYISDEGLRQIGHSFSEGIRTIYKFVQIQNGRPYQVFTEDRIVVLDAENNA